jgi:hypothetical protein
MHGRICLSSNMHLVVLIVMLQSGLNECVPILGQRVMGGFPVQAPSTRPHKCMRGGASSHSNVPAFDAFECKHSDAVCTPKRNVTRA